MTSKASIATRTKDSRLCGADLYVARLGPSRKQEIVKVDFENTSVSEDAVTDSQSSPRSSSLSGSLHEELSCCCFRSASPIVANISKDPKAPPEIRSSRPCYRCITYIHSVGIKRVFWTNDAGGWDNAKVRDLVDGFEGRASGGKTRQEQISNMGAFVTKHEVLMMLRSSGGIRG